MAAVSAVVPSSCPLEGTPLPPTGRSKTSRSTTSGARPPLLWALLAAACWCGIGLLLGREAQATLSSLLELLTRLLYSVPAETDTTVYALLG